MRFTDCATIIAVISFFLLVACNNSSLYKAGNRKMLIDLPIERNVNQDIILSYINSFYAKGNNLFALPERFDFLKYGGDLQYFPENNKVIYFKNFPAEAYHVSSNGLFFLCQVFNPSKYPNGWLKSRVVLNKDDYGRIEKRIDTLLHEVVKEAKLNHVPDSVIFLNEQYDTIICKLKRP